MSANPRALALLGALAACADAPSPTPPPLRQGLARLYAEDAPPTIGGTAHLSRLVALPPRWHVANGFAGVMTFEVRGDQVALSATTEPVGAGVPAPETVTRCTSLAAHTPSRTLFCAGADAGLSRLSLAVPDAPAVVSRAVILPARQGLAGLLVVGDALYAAGFRAGLLRATVAADGAPGPFSPAGVDGDIVGVDGDAARMFALDRERGLLRLAPAGAGWAVRDALALDGPVLGLRVRGARAAVALGSSGVVVVDVAGDAMRVTARVAPPCIASSVDLRDDRLAVGCTTGVWLYDLRGAVPRVAGSDPARFGVLDLAFDDDGRRLMALDWRAIVRYAVDLDGVATTPELEGATWLRPGVDGVIWTRAPGGVPIRVRFSMVTPATGEEADLGALDVPPNETRRFVVPAGKIAQNLHNDFITVNARSEQGGAPQQMNFGVALRGAPGGRPTAEGERFPTLPARPGVAGPAELPLAEPTRMAFLIPDCALQWPAFEDLAWQHRRGRLWPDARVFVPVLTAGGENTWEVDGVFALLGATDLPRARFGAYTATLVPGRSGSEAFEARFGLGPLGGGDATEVFTLEADGTVTGISRRYRGNWSSR